MTGFNTALLQPGDVLLYGGNSIFDRAIGFMTWSNCHHVEIAISQVQSVASRNGKGVNIYPTRTEGLRYVLRPNVPLDFSNGMAWFYSHAKGKPYGWLDLLRFIGFNLKNPGDGLICSEFSALFFQACAAPLFNVRYSAGIITPRDHLITPRLDLFWSYNKNVYQLREKG
jgi:hypothetical protein